MDWRTLIPDDGAPSCVFFHGTERFQIADSIAAAIAGGSFRSRLFASGAASHRAEIVFFGANDYGVVRHYLCGQWFMFARKSFESTERGKKPSTQEELRTVKRSTSGVVVAST